MLIIQIVLLFNHFCYQAVMIFTNLIYQQLTKFKFIFSLIQLMADYSQLKLNILIKHCFTLQHNKKKIEKKLKKNYLILINGSNNKKIEANFIIK